MFKNKEKVYFIAEIGSNFDQSLDRAKFLINLAKDSGADAVKFQHYTARTLVSDHGFKSLGSQQSHQAKWKKSVFDTYNEASIEVEWTSALHSEAQKLGLDFFTSPYSKELVDFVDPFVPAHKIGSGDITWIEIVEHIASKKKPVLLATGASSMTDVKRAVDAILNINPQLVLMQCNTNYTIDDENFKYQQLNVLKSFYNEYPNVTLGLSDHTPGHVTVLGAVALGARVIEKHFTDSTQREGPDHPFSMTPKTWREMVDRTRELELALGTGIKKIEENEKKTVVVQRRCLRAARSLPNGTRLRREDLLALRPCPADGIEPYRLDELVGSVLIRKIEEGEHIKLSDLN
jgi:sialic acid synthase SpsE